MEQNNKNAENNHGNPNVVNYSFSRYTKPIKTVLKNIGDSSYLNAVLYCLGNIRNIASYFLNPRNQSYLNNNIGNKPLSYVFERLLIHFYPYPEKEKEKEDSYQPNAFIEVLSALNICYKTTKKRNPNDLITFLLNTLHMELNKVQNYNLNLNENKQDKNIVIKNALTKFKYTENSIIYNNVNWFELKESKCNECNNVTYELRTFSTFALNIKESHSLLKQNQNQKNYLTLYDCLDYYKSSKLHDLYCNNCSLQKKMVLITNIFSSPGNFVFLLDRGDFDNDGKNVLRIPFELSDKIELDNFIENKISPKKYQLIGIVSFNIEKQEYVSFCMSPVDKNWYSYKSEKGAEQMDISNIINKHNQFDNLIPFILIYKSC